jgi:hypothetical protein
MDRSTYLAKLFGPVLVILGLSLLVRGQSFVGVFQDILYSPTLIFVLCVLGLLGGIAVILAHNVWAKDWRLIITILGWASVIESAVWLIVPHTMLQRIIMPLLTPSFLLVYGIVVLLLGGVLSYFGYLAPRQATGHSGRPQ